jgi:hypothetical protein
MAVAESVNSLLRQCGKIDVIVDNTTTLRPRDEPPLRTFSPLDAYLGVTRLRQHLRSG